jgi:ribose transport system permease protein
VVLVPMIILRPRVMTYTGLVLLLNMAVPISLATTAQMLAMSIGEIDLSLGSLASLSTCIVCSVIPTRPAIGFLLYAIILGAYVCIGVFLYLRKLPSIIITIGMSFVWTGMAVVIQPTPGGEVPPIVQAIVSLETPLVPMPILFLVVLALVAHAIIFRTRFGIMVRGVGGNARAMVLSGHSVLRIQLVVFFLVGVFGILAGVALAGVTTSADANIASNYTLITVAGVILGGGSFSGGKVSAVGAVLGACIMTLVGSLLTFLRISPDWQVGTQGFLILTVLFLSALLKRKGRTSDV